MQKQDQNQKIMHQNTFCGIWNISQIFIKGLFGIKEYVWLGYACEMNSCEMWAVKKVDVNCELLKR